MNVGSLGAVTVSAHEVTRAERAARRAKRARIEPPRKRNQDRELRLGVLCRPWTQRVTVLKVPDGQLKHYRAAFRYGFVQYADKPGEAHYRQEWPTRR